MRGTPRSNQLCVCVRHNISGSTVAVGLRFHSTIITTAAINRSEVTVVMLNGVGVAPQPSKDTFF